MNKINARPSRMAIVAVVEWLMVLPAAVLLLAAALRLLQPRENEPTRPIWIIFQWAKPHITRGRAALLFIGMPSVVVIVGCATLLRKWRQERAFRQDAPLALAIVWRHLAAGLVAMATLLAGAILTAVVAHLITD